MTYFIRYLYNEWASLIAPCEDVKTNSFMKGLRLRSLGETMPPAVAMGLPLEVVMLLVVRCFFGAMAFEEFF